MSLWIASLVAVATISIARLVVPPRLHGRPIGEHRRGAALSRTTTLQALMLLAEAIARAILAATLIAIAISMAGPAWLADLPMAPTIGAIGVIAATMAGAVILATAPARAELRLERKIAKLTKAASEGGLPPLPPSPEMQALMEPIASVNRDIATLEQASASQAAPAELADLRKMREGLVEAFVEKDLARRIGMLRAEAPAEQQTLRAVGSFESLIVLPVRDRLIGLFRMPAAAGLAVGVYGIALIAAVPLAGQPETGLLAQRIAARAGEVVRTAEAHQIAPDPIAELGPRPVLSAVRTANLAINSLSDSSSIAVEVELTPPDNRNEAAKREIAALTNKLAETEQKLVEAEKAVSNAQAEQRRLMEEAERTRDVDVATVASDAQLERMAHEAAMAVEEERLHQKELELADRLAELKETQAALQEEKQRLVAMIEDKRRQAQAWEARVRLERQSAAAEARDAERVAIAERALEADRFKIEKLRQDERMRALKAEQAEEISQSEAKPAEVVAYVPASAPVADGADTQAAPPAALVPLGAWRAATVDLTHTQVPSRTEALEKQASLPGDVATPPAPAVTEDSLAPAQPLSLLAQRECERVRAEAQALSNDTAVGDPASAASSSRKLKLEAVRALLECGQSLMTAGELLAARLAFEQVATAGIAKGALALGTTYDPHALAKANLDGSSANSKLARFWYKRALKLSGQ